MRVMLDGTQAGNRSGTGEYTHQLAAWLPRVAPDIEMVAAWPKGIPAPEGAVTVPIPQQRARGLTYAVSRGRHLQQADLIHYPASIGHGANLARAVVTVHDVSCLVNPAWFRWPHALYYRTMIARSARRAAAVIADSEATAHDLRECLGLGSAQISVVPLGVDPVFRPVSREDAESVRRRYSLPEQFLLFVGTHEPRKNLVRVVEAFGRIADEIPHALVLAGRRGWKCGSLNGAVAASHARERILLPGFIPRAHLPALLTAAAGFVWPSLHEGFGLPPLEAMACGTPVLTSNAASLPEVVGDAALLANPEDTGDIASHMLTLATDDALRGTLRDKGFERARRFTWQRTAEMTVDVYRRVWKGLQGS